MAANQITLPYLPNNWNNSNYGNTNGVANNSNNGNVLGGVGNSLFGLNRVTTGPDTRVYAKDILTNYNAINQQADTIGGALNNGNAWLKDTLGNGFRVNNGVLQKSYTDENGTTSWLDMKGDSVVSGSDGTSLDWNFGQMMGGITNLANMGLGIASGVMAWDQYKQNKDLLNKNKQLLEQQIEQNTRDMAYVKKERERQDTMRSNVAAQRNSTSNVRSF